MISPNEYKILLVEDDASIREVLAEFLTDEGYQLTTAADGLEAMEIFKAKQFDLLISDFRNAQDEWSRTTKLVSSGEDPFTCYFYHG
jgi:CheY-like chemotaxis protein